MTTERDSLRERLKISRETAISERAHLEQRVEDLQTAMYTLEQDHGDLQSKLAAMKKTVMDLEEALSSQGHKLAAAEGELKRSREEYNALRMTHNQLEAALDDSQLRLTARYGELLTSQEKNKQLEGRNDALLQQIRSLCDEITGLQSTVSELDQRKNDLQEALEKECDLLASATDQLDEKERLIRSLKIRVEELESSSACLQEKVSRQERELATLRRNLADSEKELATLTQIKDEAHRENSLLRNELEKARLDHQVSPAVRVNVRALSVMGETQSRRELWGESSRLNGLFGNCPSGYVMNIIQVLQTVLRELDACRSEAELLRKQLANERLSMKSLESMLQSTREKELQSALSTQEQHAEIQLLRDKLTAADSRTCTQDRELAQLRIRTEQLESDLDLTRRQLSAERFQREWAVQELRLHGLATSARSGSPPYHPLSPRLSWSPDRVFHSSPERRAAENAL
ncbi:hypothetical protein GJAV_G00213330 [Gymnothorax javanicus]|nr:hypothetical protein GJAV_G00213330 [Gymnothorax javanicus]